MREEVGESEGGGEMVPVRVHAQVLVQKPNPAELPKKGTRPQHICTDLQGSPLGTSARFLPRQRKMVSNINPGMAWIDFFTPPSP